MLNMFLCADALVTGILVADGVLCLGAIVLLIWFVAKNRIRTGVAKNNRNAQISKVDDETYVIETEVEEEITPVYEEDNNVVHFVNQISDINEERNTELNANTIVVNHEVEMHVKKQLAKDEIENFVVVAGEKKTKTEEELIEVMKWYDYIEVQPPENYSHLLRGRDISSVEDIHKVIKKIINCAKKADKIIVATGDVHNIHKEDLIYREIIVNQNSPAKGRHPLARSLNAKKRANNNESLLETLRQISVNEYGDALTPVEEKVLKLIFSLTEFKDLPITRTNLLELYQPDKKEEVFRKSKTGDEKKEAILSALRKFESRNFIKTRYIEAIGQEVYVLKYELAKAGDEEEPHIPNQFFRTTNEMMDEFYFLDEELREEIIIDNPKKLLDQEKQIKIIDFYQSIKK